MGQEVVVFRAASGQACAADAYCPHLGAHFGYGGRVEGDLLRCPFHGFCFDTTGACVKTGYGTNPPPAARLKVWPLREVNGMLLLYYDGGGAPPAWNVPALETAGWTPLRYRAFELADHPQETTENSVDVGHFAFIHGYRDVRTLRQLEIAEHTLRTGYAVSRPFVLVPRLLPAIWMETQFETEISGLGYSLVRVTVPRLSLRARFWVLPTATDPDRIILRLAVSMEQLASRRIHPMLGLLPGKLLSALIAHYLLRGFVHDTRQDFPIWEHKRYISPPALARGDGPIGKYRVWARQFYAPTTIVSSPGISVSQSGDEGGLAQRRS
jgi:nitrite reductase/ring-hydroxylating ferredoxin subunit